MSLAKEELKIPLYPLRELKKMISIYYQEYITGIQQVLPYPYLYIIKKLNQDIIKLLKIFLGQVMQITRLE